MRDSYILFAVVAWVLPRREVYGLTTSPDYSPLGLDQEYGPTVDPLPLGNLRPGMVLIDVSCGSLIGILDEEHLNSSGALQEVSRAPPAILCNYSGAAGHN